MDLKTLNSFKFILQHISLQMLLVENILKFLLS